MGKILDIDQMREGIAQVDREQEESEALERTLKPFNPYNVPYSTEAIIHMAKMYASQYVGGGAGLGMCLVLLKEHENASTFVAIMAEHFSWINERVFRCLTRFARFAAKSAKFMEIFGRQGMMNKGLALLAGLTDPEIDEILVELEETGEIKGLTEADLLGKTYKQIVLENKRLRLGQIKAVEDLEKKNERLQKRIDALRAGSEVAGLEKSLKLLASGEESITDGMATVAGADFALLARDAGSVQRVRLLVDKMRRVAGYLEDEMFGAGK